MRRIIFTLSALIIAASAMAQQNTSIEVLGHRGGRYEFDENTISAFEGAYKKGIHSFQQRNIPSTQAQSCSQPFPS